MSGKGKRVLAAMSGGVDSTAAAMMLLEAGFDCAGVFMITADHTQGAQQCARRVADKLGIQLDVLDLRGEFETILDYFCGEYAKGRTPNPCVVCNRNIKFGRLWDFAKTQGADFLATGHYARVIRDQTGAGLYEALDPAKDQSYALAMVRREMLCRLILPMGDYSKRQAREIAGRLGLGIEKNPESQEICFVPGDDYVSVVERRCPQLVRSGRIVSSASRLLGEHDGIHRFTIGQRRGLKVAMGQPYYVVRLDAQSNTVTLGPVEELMHRKLAATEVNWLTDRPADSFRAKVRIRYNDRGAAASVSLKGDKVEVEFDEPVSAITPGQLAAFYVQQDCGNRVVGAGWIETVGD